MRASAKWRLGQFDRQILIRLRNYSSIRMTAMRPKAAPGLVECWLAATDPKRTSIEAQSFYNPIRPLVQRLGQINKETPCGI